jgi:hypothetical protein
VETGIVSSNLGKSGNSLKCSTTFGHSSFNQTGQEKGTTGEDNRFESLWASSVRFWPWAARSSASAHLSTGTVAEKNGCRLYNLEDLPREPESVAEPANAREKRAATILFRTPFASPLVLFTAIPGAKR